MVRVTARPDLMQRAREWLRGQDIDDWEADHIDIALLELLAAVEREAIEMASPNDLRALGWTVAAHNDYRLDGFPHTFWLFTKGGRAIKGEGLTDAEALDQIRAIAAPETPRSGE